MSASQFCAGHLNNFEHLDPKLAGLDRDFDLGKKFVCDYPDSYKVDPVTSVKVWQEPILMLYISVAHRDWPPNKRPTLHYGRTRSRFAEGLEPSNTDRKDLLAQALECVKTDIGGLDTGSAPDTPNKVRML